MSADTRPAYRPRHGGPISRSRRRGPRVRGRAASRSPSSGCVTAACARVSAVCPHKGGPIADGQIDSAVVLCPLHLNAFDLDHRLLDHGRRPLQHATTVTVDGDQIIVVADPPATHALTPNRNRS